MLKNGLNYKFYFFDADPRLKDFIFVKIIETNESNKKLNLNTFFKAVYFIK